MKIKIEIKMDNAAFKEREGIEVSRILNQLGQKLEHTVESNGLLFDLNGNRVGTWKIVGS